MVVFSFLLTWSLAAFSAPNTSLSEDARVGYISSTQGEENQVIEDLRLVAVPEEAVPKDVQERIFDKKVTKELSDTYREKFGYTETDRVFNPAVQGVQINIHTQPGLTWSSIDNRFLSPEEYKDKKRAYGEYLMRKLGEHHVDLYFRSDPKLREVWELKERIGNVNVQVSEGVRIESVYSYAGNFLLVDVKSPIVSGRARIEMNPAAIGPSEINESIFSLFRDLGSNISLEGIYKVKEGSVTVIGTKQISENIKTNLQTGSDWLVTGESVPQSWVLAGLSIFY